MTKQPPTGKHTMVLMPSRQLPGIWVAHFLEIDLITQGEGPEGAIEMALDAWKLYDQYNSFTLEGSDDLSCCPRCDDGESPTPIHSPNGDIND